MAERIKVIIKRPDEKLGHVAHISNTLESLQNHVKGHIEAIPLSSDTVMICNEEGKIRNLSKNFLFGNPPIDVIYGPVIVCGVNGDEFSDITFSIQTWKSLLQAWKNDI